MKTPVDGADHVVRGLAQPELRGPGGRGARDAGRPTSSAGRSREAPSILRRLVHEPGPVLLALAIIVVLALLGLSRATWRPTAPLDPVRRRAWGQIIAASGRMYRRRIGLFVGIGLLLVPISLVRRPPPDADAQDVELRRHLDRGPGRRAARAPARRPRRRADAARDRSRAGRDDAGARRDRPRTARSARSAPTGWRRAGVLAAARARS